jgi:hypothetical protein
MARPRILSVTCKTGFLKTPTRDLAQAVTTRVLFPTFLPKPSCAPLSLIPFWNTTITTSAHVQRRRYETPHSWKSAYDRR